MTQLWTERDVSLFALSIGLGSMSFPEKSASNHDYLRFVYEEHPDFSVFPTMPFGTMYNTGAEAVWTGDVIKKSVDFDPNFLVHGEQHVEWPQSKFGLVDSSKQATTLGYEFFEVRGKSAVLSATTPSGFPTYYPARLTGVMKHRILAIIPKSTGVLVTMQSVLSDSVMGAMLCVMTGTAFLRKGTLKIPFDDIHRKFPDVNAPAILSKLHLLAPRQALPSKPIDKSLETTRAIHVAQNQALLYRLNGDRNSIHVDPAVAGRVGFSKKGPILHGLATMSMAVRDIVLMNPKLRLQSVGCRMTAPVWPGDSLTMAFSQCSGSDGSTTISFELRNAEGQVVLGGGLAVLLAGDFTGAAVGSGLQSRPSLGWNKQPSHI
jgi:acyl dehydratase